MMKELALIVASITSTSAYAHVSNVPAAQHNSEHLLFNLALVSVVLTVVVLGTRKIVNRVRSK